MIEEPRDAGRRLLRRLLELRAVQRDPATLDLLVTHDLTLVALLSLVRDVADRSFPWPGYLEGFVLEPRAGAVRWWHRDEEFCTDDEGRPAAP